MSVPHFVDYLGIIPNSRAKEFPPSRNRSARQLKKLQKKNRNASRSPVEITTRAFNELKALSKKVFE